ncbi:Thiosulfate sulfurtransferase [Pseudobythopirellula maris]|uniref:Thiosulfate sulfurtransferase n=1 Tax=Pseudobythopirellula maris TaxID=2527991 RepID=A0A5C5ZNT5_9BACT|nr:rhodanese-like domain-containing protein [Pseudobythopirellula maris]TWT88093.1 Thiosulfate sulfurtransferase [Pseudobythopirellula maris]
MPTPRRVTSLLLLAALQVPASDAAEYARPELLVEPAVLGSIEGDVVLLDARSAEDYAAGHLPGALHADAYAWRDAFGAGDDPAAWGERIGALGVGDATTVVVYDQALTGAATRVWWILKYWGAENARVLNGGVTAWREAGRDLTRTAPPRPTPAGFHAVAHPERHATADEVLRGVGAPGEVCLLDTRSDREVSEGKIPAAAHLEWSELVDRDTGKLLAAGELTARLAAAGFEADKPAVTYCRSGGRAAVAAFVLEVMGAERVSNYHGSWREWSALPDSPVELPKPAE